MRNPCLVCELRDLDKNRPECVGCDRRVTYVSSMGSLSCSVPEIMTIGHIRQPVDVSCKTKTKTEETKMKKTKICKNTDCPHGGKPQDLQKAFHKHSKAADGRNPLCKTCRAKIARDSRNAKMEKAAAPAKSAEEVRAVEEIMPVEEVKADRPPVLDPEMVAMREGGQVDPPAEVKDTPFLTDLLDTKLAVIRDLEDFREAESMRGIVARAFEDLIDGLPDSEPETYRLNFTDYPWLKDKLDLSAKAEFRTPEMQVMYILSLALEDVDSEEEAA